MHQIILSFKEAITPHLREIKLWDILSIGGTTLAGFINFSGFLFSAVLFVFACRRHYIFEKDRREKKDHNKPSSK